MRIEEKLISYAINHIKTYKHIRDKYFYKLFLTSEITEEKQEKNPQKHK